MHESVTLIGTLRMYYHHVEPSFMSWDLVYHNYGLSWYRLCENMKGVVFYMFMTISITFIHMSYISDFNIMQE